MCLICKKQPGEKTLLREIFHELTGENGAFATRPMTPTGQQLITKSGAPSAGISPLGRNAPADHRPVAPPGSPLHEIFQQF